MIGEFASILGGIGDSCIALAALVIDHKDQRSGFLPDSARRWLRFGIVAYVVFNIPRLFVAVSP